MSACILNQCTGHWLLDNALNFAISMSLKFKDEIDFATFDYLMKKNGMLFRFWILFFPSYKNMKKENLITCFF